MTEVTAKLSYLRVGPRKMRLLADLVRGKKVEKAIVSLSLSSKRLARPLLKLLQSAVANAKHNHSLEAHDLRIKSITVDGGPSLKRFMPKAHGRATPVRERTSHINLTLEKIGKGEVVEAPKKEEVKKEVKAKATEKKKVAKKKTA